MEELISDFLQIPSKEIQNISFSQHIGLSDCSESDRQYIEDNDVSEPQYIVKFHDTKKYPVFIYLSELLIWLYKKNK